MTKTAEKNLLDAPLYTPLDVARYLCAPVWLVVGAWHGWFPPHPELFFPWYMRGLRHFDQEELPDIPELRERWTFRQMTDLYVRFFAIESLLELTRSKVPESRIDDAIYETTRGILSSNQAPVFFGASSHEEGLARVLEVVRPRLAEAAVMWLEKRLRLCLGRFDMEAGLPSRLYPFSRVPAEGSPRMVVMDPAIRFGRPTVTGHGTPTDILLERHQAGDPIVELAEDYGMTTAEIEEAIRYEARPLSLLSPFCCW